MSEGGLDHEVLFLFSLCIVKLILASLMTGVPRLTDETWLSILLISSDAVLGSFTDVEFC